MSNSQFHEAFVALLSERWRQQESPDEIDRDFRFLFAAVEIDQLHERPGTGRGNPPPRPLHDILEDLKATGRGGPGPRPLHPVQLFSVYGKLSMQRAGHINDQVNDQAAGNG